MSSDSQIPPSQKPARTVWLLTDGAPGHLSQSRGLVDALACLSPVQVVDVKLAIHGKNLKRLARLLSRFGLLPNALVQAVYRWQLPSGRPDVIVASGGNTLLACAALRRQFEVPAFYSGTLKGFSGSLFSAVFTVTPQPGKNNVVLPLPPVPRSLVNLTPAALPPDAPLLLLLGGDGAGYAYRESDWRALALAMNHLSQQSGRRWLLTSSRRTGNAAEQALQAMLDPTVIAEAVWWSQTPRPVVREFLQRAAAVFVSEDSLTMIAEAIYSGRPVFSFHAEIGRVDDNDITALAGYVASGRLQRRSIVSLADLSSPFYPTPPVPDVHALMASAMVPAFAVNVSNTKNGNSDKNDSTGNNAGNDA